MCACACMCTYITIIMVIIIAQFKAMDKCNVNSDIYNTYVAVQ